MILSAFIAIAKRHFFQESKNLLTTDNHQCLFFRVFLNAIAWYNLNE
ncbi:MAG: hypothetical protein VKJ02_04400 [Snowella sp.]|nr:hypothetical protein [Snowella sp.]